MKKIEKNRICREVLGLRYRFCRENSKWGTCCVEMFKILHCACNVYSKS